MNLTSSEPFWLIKNGLLQSYPSLREDISTDILIVGAGITGALMAHKCISEGYSTTIIDRREIANGSTSATTSMLQYEIDIPLFELNQRIGKSAAEANYWAGCQAIDELEEIVKEIKSTCGFKKKDSLYYASYKKDIPQLQKEFEARQNAGLEVKWLSEEEISSIYGLQNAYGGILSRQGASVDAFKLSHDLLAYNQSKGLRIFDKTELLSTHTTKGGIVAATSYKHKITAKKVIYCTGYESIELIKESFVNLLSTYVIIGERVTSEHKNLNNTLFWNTAKPYIYMRTTEDNRLLIGGEDEEFIAKDKREAALHKKSKKLAQTLQRILPDYDFRTDFSWAGTFGETKDGLPYIGTHPSYKQAYFLLGFGGNGITFSVIGTNVIADMLKDKQHPLAPYYRFGR